MTGLPRFDDFDDPAGAGAFVRSTLACACCGQARGWLSSGGSFGPEPGLHRACPWCLADGSAADRTGARFNLPETAAPVPAAVLDTLMRRTPCVITWQDLEWPVCCGDACVFLGYAGAQDLRERWPEAGRALADAYEPGLLGTRTAAEFLECFDGEDIIAYVFRCRHCGRRHTPWDLC